MPKTSTKLSFDDFKPSQPKPTIPEKHLDGTQFICDGCGAPYPYEGAWCPNCVNAWKEAYPVWLELNNTEFEAWFALHKDELTTPLKSNGIHNSEFVPDRIIEDRNKHFPDTIQPWREGEPSREYIQQYPKQAKKMFTDKELKSARPVWRDIAPRKFKGTI